MKRYDIFLKEKGTIGAWTIYCELEDDVPVEIVKQVLQGRFAKLLTHLREENKGE